MAPHASSFAHPGWPKAHGSRRPFVSPQPSIVFTAHSPAALRLGEPVTRGPYTSARKCSVRMTCDLFMPSSRMRALRSPLMRSSAAKGSVAAAQNSSATASVRGLIVEVIELLAVGSEAGRQGGLSPESSLDTLVTAAAVTSVYRIIGDEG